MRNANRILPALVIAVLAGGSITAQDVELVLEPPAPAIRTCDELVIDVVVRNLEIPLSGYQLFVRFPADYFEALRFEPVSVDATVFVVGPPPLGSGFAPCEVGTEDPWDDGAGEDVVAIAASVIRSDDDGISDPPVSGAEVVLGRLVFAPIATATSEQARFALNEEICWTLAEQTTLLFDDLGDLIDFVPPDPFGLEILDLQSTVEDLSCEPTAMNEVTLQWSLPGDTVVDAIRVYRNGVLLEGLPPTSTSYVDPDTQGLGEIDYDVIVVQGGGLESCQVATCSILIDMPFRRGDVNVDGSVNISDPVALLFYLFQAGSIDCDDAADINDDGRLNISDAVYGLNYLFTSGPQPPEPFEAMGEDLTEDDLHCASFRV